MRSVRRAAAVTASSLALVVVAPGSPALADAPSRTGWWNAATAGGVALPQPTTGADDLHVGQGPGGPSAFAAVAYDLVGGSVTGATLRLDVVPDSAVGTLDVTACPTKGATWTAGGNQPLDAAPSYDCALGVPGVVAADGTGVTFALGAAPAAGFSLAVVPAAGALPFSVDFAAPGPTSLDVQAASAPDTEVVVAEPVPPAPGRSGEVLQAGPVAPPPPLPPEAPAPVAAAPAPQAAPPPVPAGPLQRASAPLAPPSDRDRYAAGTLLALLAGGLVWAFQQPPTTPRLIGGMSRRSAPAVAPAVDPRPRGIGRFATLRTAPPRRLV